MRCLICGSKEVDWQSTTMEDETEGFMEYDCKLCKGKSETGFKIITWDYTGKNNVFPREYERGD